MYKVRNASTLGSHCNADVSLQALRQASGAPYYRLSKRTCDEKPSTCKQHKAQTCMNIRLASPAFAEHCALNHSSAANDMCYVTPFTHATMRAQKHLFTGSGHKEKRIHTRWTDPTNVSISISGQRRESDNDKKQGAVSPTTAYSKFSG